ncbi:penicillin acylase family protein [bacterium BMS3Abin03]|nr:penicillin acylase family protein [bacterium BMS3Abin03]MCG6959240.1 penicillin acylase family protein [bacterium BMS3Abin03]
MRTWLKITLGILISFLLIFIIGGYIFYRMLNNSLPMYEGSLSVPGLKNNVEIYFDSLAIPYIYASNDEDAAFALGYLHAQERMFIMDVIRRAGEGRLSEVFGKETLPFDKMFRTIGIKQTAEMIKRKMNSDALKILEAYSGGVNYYINKYKSKYTFEFDLLGYEPEQWTPENSLVVIRMMGWELNLSWWTDITFTELAQKLGKEKVKDILPGYPENAPTIIPDHLNKFADVNTSFIETDKAFRKFFGFTGTHIGSNNWVVNNSLSASGSPIIANDPHLAFSAPGKWYAAVIKSPEWSAAGVTLPGVPGVVIGKNENISWVLTNIMTDDCDFYFEKLDSSGTKYLVDSKWRELKMDEDTIFVKGEKPVPITIRKTHRGPIISDIYPYNFVYNKSGTKYPTMSMHWVGNDFSDEAEAFMEINKASNWKEFKSAVQKFNVPGQNFVYADKDGNIGYLFGGVVPLRGKNPTNVTSTTFIFDGTTSANDWTGLLSKNKSPELFNPPQNYIASANNKTVKNFNYHITNLWEPSSRIERITELLSSKEKQSVQDFKKYQMDIVSPYAKKVVSYILQAFKDITVTDKNLKQSLELLGDWDFELSKYRQAPTIYLTTFKFLLENTYEDEMGSDLFNQYVFMANIPYRNILDLLQNANSNWWDDVNTPERETRNEIIRKSVANALTYLEENVSGDIKDWQWGELHYVTFKHMFSGNFSLLDDIINIGPYELGGDGTTIFNTEYRFSKSIEKIPMFKHDLFENVLGPSMRYLYDFSEPDEFYLILTTGQSGNVMSNHYSDQSLMWLNGRYMKISTNDETIKAPPNKLLTLVP